ncbi:MAG: asparaginase [Vitreoscilla sp.]|nr:asparaginase [Burkholderiales bacterium]MBP6337122.1 asparaginase [Vitreoscilla sp.]MBP6674189.1 asparaginase [Vitreoscilla sp.]
MNHATTSQPVLVEALRGDAVESFHRGALAVVDADGTVLHALGDIHRPVFPRSAVKLLQALPLVASGAADALGLSNEELALACASHGGEPMHVRTAAGMLRKAGLSETALECGAHWPGFEGASRALAREGREPDALHNNCSGKHAGFVCLGCLLARQAGQDAAAFTRGYVKASHPVMREVSAALQAATGHDLASAPVGTDGCSIPTYAQPLHALALGFARVATGLGLSAGHAQAALRLRQAIARAPQMVAGTGRFDTRVMQHFGERVCCKVGAEGVYCAALPERGLGVAIKVDDGQGARAAEVAMAQLLHALVARSDADHAVLQPLREVVLRNWNGLAVGRLRPAPALATLQAD